LRNIAYLPKRSCETLYGRRHPPAMTLVQEELNKQGTISHISDTVTIEFGLKSIWAMS
jgi:choline/glycine/proline betaine transport protein